MKQANKNEEIDLDMEIIGLLQELTGLCRILTSNQTKMMKLQTIIIDQISVMNLNDFPEEYGGHS